MTQAWTPTEVALIVADYFAMFACEMRRQSYNKTAHRRALIPLLNDRPGGAVERKHQNISAILLEMNMPYISGYKPLRNYQGLLREAVESHVSGHPEIESLVAEDVDAPVAVPATGDMLRLLEAPPAPIADRTSDHVGSYRTRPLSKIDYLAREARNSSLGDAGERFVLEFERARLISAGLDRIADKVERISETRGDGAGYDLLSFDEQGREQFVEVKTTKYGKQTPFYVTRNEVDVSAEAASKYRLCRVFDFRRRPRLFELHGPLKESCRLQPESYVARVG